MVMLTCFWLNAQFGVFLEAPKMVEKNGAAAFVYEIKPAIIVFFIPSAIFLIHLLTVIVRICKNNPTMKVQYEPVMLGVLALFLGNAFLGIPFFSGFPIDILSGVVNVFLLFYALIRRTLVPPADAGIPFPVLWCWIPVFHSCFLKYCSIPAKSISYAGG